VFGITTAADFREKSARDNAALQADVSNVDVAINAILSAYHLHEWVWRLVLKPRKPVSVRGAVLRNSDDWKTWLDQNFPHFGLLRDLANGSKHCVPVSNAGKVEGYGQGPYGVGPYGKPYLLIDQGQAFSPEARWLVGNRVVREAAEFWAALDAELNFSNSSPVDPQIAGTH